MYTVKRKSYSDLELDIIFERAPRLSGLMYFSDLRLCPSGRVIRRDAYGKIDDPCCWEVGHKEAIARGGTNDLSNLEAQSVSYNRSLQERTPIEALAEALLRDEEGAYSSSTSLTEALIKGMKLKR